MNGPNIRTPRTSGEWHPSRMDAIEHYRKDDSGPWVVVVVIVALVVAMTVHFVRGL